MKRLSTYFPKPSDKQQETWELVDAEGQILGRLARDIAVKLQGKDLPTYTPSSINGSFVVVTNVEKINVTGNKYEDKMYYRHSGYVGNLKSFTYKEMSETNPERILRLAVKGMLPNNKLGRKMLTRLKIYSGDTHPHTSQLG
ncbi:MAG: 50S ribosomal protein L13 [SAR202 cluster bacterium]|nr:50S ribosomal protein L13 [SAR202 cluster bacterium]|tara:strand:+ start:2201 stop:2626 length:426 start_codon:yes stop_codon:yes gene_type:complete